MFRPIIIDRRQVPDDDLNYRDNYNDNSIVIQIKGKGLKCTKLGHVNSFRRTEYQMMSQSELEKDPFDLYHSLLKYCMNNIVRSYKC
jgi:hypothetical protein